MEHFGSGLWMSVMPQDFMIAPSATVKSDAQPRSGYCNALPSLSDDAPAVLVSTEIHSAPTFEQKICPQMSDAQDLRRHF